MGDVKEKRCMTVQELSEELGICKDRAYQRFLSDRTSATEGAAMYAACTYLKG